MLKRKILAAGLTVVVAASLLAGCGTKNEGDKQPEATAQATSAPQQGVKYQDGVYFAQEDVFAEGSGWKYMVTIEVKDGKIIDAQWNGAHKDAGTDKIARSESGEYGMVAKGGAKAEWHEQAAKAEAYLIEKQDPTAVTYKDEEGHTDAISGASIHVKEFFDLAKKALDKGPVARGQYKDGSYTAEEKEFASSGWKGNVSITVVNGYIVAVSWNATHKDGGDDKKTQSADGRYGMVEKGGAKAEWHEQAAKVEAYLLETQDAAAITYKDNEGHTDAISGATIHVNDFYALVEEALSKAR